MTDLRRFGWADAGLLALVLLVAAGARAAYLWRWADDGAGPGLFRVQDRPPTADGLVDDSGRRPPEMLGHRPPTELDELAYNLKEYRWYGCLAPFAPAEEKTADYPPGYPYLLGLLARLVPDTGDFERTVRWAQAGLGTATAALYFLFARRAFRSRTVAALAGLFTGVYPFWVVAVADLNDAVTASFLLAAVLFLGVRAGQTAGPFAGLLYGLSLAGLALVRAAFSPFAFVALVWLLWRCRTEGRGWLCAVLAFLGFANGLAPWTVRNYQAFGEPLPVVDTTYLHLWVGNNPKADGGPMNETMRRTVNADELRAVTNQPRRYDRFAHYVADEVRDHPLPTLRRRVAASGFYLFGADYFRRGVLVEGLTPDADGPDAEAALLGTLLGLYVLAILGWRWTSAWRRDSVPAPLAVLLAPLPYLLGHAEGLHGPRLPLDGVLLCYAAFALAWLVPGVGAALRAGPAAAPA